MFHSNSTSPEEAPLRLHTFSFSVRGYDTYLMILVNFVSQIDGDGLKRKQSLDPVQKARHADSQRSRLIFGPKPPSTRLEKPLRNMLNLPRNSTNSDLPSSAPLNGVKNMSSNLSTAIASGHIQSPSTSDYLIKATKDTSTPPSMTLKRSGRSLYQRFDAEDSGKLLSSQWKE